MKPLILFLAMLFTIHGMGQNLVPNPSFEEYNTCPNPGFTNIESCNNWINPTTYTPDYYNSCANLSNPNYSVPNNWCGNQFAKSGNAYAGLFIPVAAGANVREYIQVPLITPLVSGASYKIKFYASISDNSEYSVNSLGLYLSNSPVSSSDNFVLDLNPQIINNAILNPLIDKNIWYEISGVYTSIGGEKYITIGNFEYDTETDTTSVAGGTMSGESYYYIDDVSVQIDSSVEITELFDESIFNLYPNPSSNLINIYLHQSGNYYIKIIDLIGNIMYFNNVHSYQSIDVNNYPNGTYFVQLFEENKPLSTKLITINHY